MINAQILNLDVGKPFGREYYFADNEALPLKQAEKKKNLFRADGALYRPTLGLDSVCFRGSADVVV